MLFKEYISDCVFENANMYANSDLSNFILDMFVGSNCNLKCKHCYFGDNYISNAELTKDDWIQIIKDFSLKGCRHFHISGRESLLSKKTMDVLAYLALIKETKNIYYGIITNGTSLSCDEYNNILNSNIDYLEFSLDGLCTNHDLLRGNGVFDSVYQTIAGILNKTKVNLSFSVYEGNNNDFVKVISLFSNIGINKFFCSPIQAVGNAQKHNLHIINCQDYVNLIQQTIEYISKSNCRNIDVKFCLTSAYVDYLLKNDVFLDKVGSYLDSQEPIMWDLGNNNIVEVSLQMFSIPYFYQASITSDGYILGSAESVCSVTPNDMAIYKDIENFLVLRKNIILENLNNKET